MTIKDLWIGMIDIMTLNLLQKLVIKIDQGPVTVIGRDLTNLDGNHTQIAVLGHTSLTQKSWGGVIPDTSMIAIRLDHYLVRS